MFLNRTHEQSAKGKYVSSRISIDYVVNWTLQVVRDDNVEDGGGDACIAADECKQAKETGLDTAGERHH